MEQGDDTVKHAVKQDQIHDLLFNREIGWQDIIYDLIHSEQLNPWDIDIVLLTDKFLERIQALEEADFFVSSKVLFAAALLLRIKSEILLNSYIKGIDEILFGKKEKKQVSFERIELEEDVPALIPRSPLPRLRRISLQELMQSLEKAIITENRRIKKEIIQKNALRDVEDKVPKVRFTIKEKIKVIHEKIRSFLGDGKRKSVPFTEFSGDTKEEKINAFSPLLHLDHQKKIWLHQEKPLEEIHIWLRHLFFKEHEDPFLELRGEASVDEANVRKKKVKQLNKDFENPLGDQFR